MSTYYGVLLLYTWAVRLEVPFKRSIIESTSDWVVSGLRRLAVKKNSTPRLPHTWQDTLGRVEKYYVVLRKILCQPTPSCRVYCILCLLTLI